MGLPRHRMLCGDHVKWLAGQLSLVQEYVSALIAVTLLFVGAPLFLYFVQQTLLFFKG